MNHEMYQSVILTFDDGTKATFTGKAYVFPGCQSYVTAIHFSEPRPMPDGASWEEVPSNELIKEPAPKNLN